MDVNETTEAEEIHGEPEERAEEAGAPAYSPEAESDAMRAFVHEDVLDFVAHYPGFDADAIEALERNEPFRRFCGTRFAREPLAQLYGDYLSLMGEAAEAAASRTASRSARSTGGGTAGGAVLSPVQRRTLDAWNEANPEMRMTAKEYLSM